MTNRPKQTNEKSILLQENENDSIFSCLGRSCVSLATAVVQLYLAQPPNQQKWNKRFCGVVCFVKDNPKRSYFIRMYDLKNKQMLWEQELYTQFKYKCPRDYFHTFEADECQAGLNFASEVEASKFKQVVEGKMLERARKRMERKKQQQGGKNVPAPPSQSSKGPANVGNGAPLSSSNVSLNKTAAPVKESSSSKKKSGKDKKKKLTKDDISTPTDFRHVSHVGWDPNTGLDMKKLDPDMKALFEQVGIHDQSQVDEETLDFIYDFVDKHGGINAVREEMAKRPPPPPVQSHSAPPPPPPQSRAPSSVPSARPPPPPPSRAPSAAPPPPPHRGGPPPPPPGRQGAAPPPPPPSRSQGPPPPPPPGGRGFGPPPPPPSDAKYAGGMPPPPPPANVPLPPPPPSAPAPPPPPPTGGAFPPPPPPSSKNGGGRSALLDAIHKGTSLKKVEAGGGVGGGSSDPRGGLLSAIREGATLKPVQHHEAAAPSEPAGIVGALAQALAQRKNVIQGSDDEDGSSDDVDDDDEDEWDD